MKKIYEVHEFHLKKERQEYALKYAHLLMQLSDFSHAIIVKDIH